MHTFVLPSSLSYELRLFTNKLLNLHPNHVNVNAEINILR